MARRMARLGNSIMHLRFAAVFLAVAFGVTVSACSYRYHMRYFPFISHKTSWGTVYINVGSTGQWREKGVHVSGTPYDLSFAPRLKEAPAPDCKLVIRALTIARATGGAPLVSRDLIELQATPPAPRETNYRYYSPHFSFVPLVKEYMAVGSLKNLDLPYEPLRIRFDIEGGPTCPAGLRNTIHFDRPMNIEPMKGTGYYPSV